MKLISHLVWLQIFWGGNFAEGNLSRGKLPRFVSSGAVVHKPKKVSMKIVQSLISGTSILVENTENMFEGLQFLNEFEMWFQRSSDSYFVQTPHFDGSTFVPQPYFETAGYFISHRISIFSIFIIFQIISIAS